MAGNSLGRNAYMLSSRSTRATLTLNAAPLFPRESLRLQVLGMRLPVADRLEIGPEKTVMPNSYWDGYSPSIQTEALSSNPNLPTQNGLGGLKVIG